MENNSSKNPTAQGLAQTYESKIKDFISSKFEIEIETLSLFNNSEAGAYFSTNEANTFCCLIAGKRGDLVETYVFVANLNGNELTDFRSEKF